MSEPTANHGDVDTCRHKVDCSGVSKGVRRNLLRRQRRYGACGSLNIGGELEAHTRGTQWRAVAIHEQGFIACAWLSFE